MVADVQICGFQVSTGNLLSNVEQVKRIIESGTGAWIVTLNTEMLSRTSSDIEYAKLLKSADMIVADGMPIVWAARIKFPKSKITGRTTGVDIVEALLRKECTIPFSIIGGVNPLAALSLYPGASDKCKYLYTDKVDLSEPQINLFERSLKQAGARLVFVALGVPKQDRLAHELRCRLPHHIIIGVGGTFEILSPQGSRAPVWMQNSGLEWMFRLTREPGRLWKRYLLYYPSGIWMLILDCLNGRQGSGG